MSLIKSIRKQLGLSVTPANNFTLTAEADNGTMKLARGNAGATTQDILTVDAAGKVVFPQGVVTGQTWQNVIGTRALGVTYTNSTPYPITVIVTCTGTNGASISTLTATVGGIAVGACSISASNGASYQSIVGSITVVIPPAATYQFGITGLGGSATIWTELR